MVKRKAQSKKVQEQMLALFLCKPKVNYKELDRFWKRLHKSTLAMGS